MYAVFSSIQTKNREYTEAARICRPIPFYYLILQHISANLIKLASNNGVKGQHLFAIYMLIEISPTEKNTLDNFGQKQVKANAFNITTETLAKNTLGKSNLALKTSQNFFLV